MSQLTCGDVTVSETDGITPDDVSLSDCSLSASEITAEDTLEATVEATNTLQATAINIEVALTAPRAAGELPAATATLDPGETVRVQAEVTGNTLGVSSEPFTIGWEVTQAEPALSTEPIEDPDNGYTTEPIQLESARFR